MRSNTSLLGRILLGIAYVRKNQKKRYFLLHSAHLIVTLRLEPPSYSRSENQKKMYFLLFFAHLIVTLYPKYEKDEETLY